MEDASGQHRDITTLCANAAKFALPDEKLSPQLSLDPFNSDSRRWAVCGLIGITDPMAGDGINDAPALAQAQVASP